MRILLTNDDGIHAAGIRSLWAELAQIANELFVVAPDAERSACSQSITVHQPIRVDKFPVENQSNVQAWAIAGTPADCIKIALEALNLEPDLIVSGINHGPNLATDVLYSGTVSAAIEGALHGIPSVAVSLAGRNPSDFTPAARFIAKFVPTMAGHALPPNTLLNVNVPDLPQADIQGVRVTKLGSIAYENVFEKRQDPRGRVYYWMGGSLVYGDNESDSDVTAVQSGYISVTPVHFDLTNYTIMNMIRDWKIELN
ncbi:5'/3'-nucleotidase SurE [Acetonema longum]|uniref:5'-nucleotidase SurE n=1 Tax=Acetonema longum DSM 6540 TaxID=1009370 RepID=F7NPB6_9FIRM|nr:5'/3'-nucleotidase SurE [Acetonema longum]EGO62078.1 stationary phase survival protein SurE [Acetonema longum DSM 6540]